MNDENGNPTCAVIHSSHDEKQHENAIFENCGVILPNNHKRRNCKDIWNAFMVDGAEFSINDIPLCPSTTDDFPKSIITYSEAKTIYNREIKSDKDFHCESFVCFYEDDQNFDGPNGIWNYPKRAYEILRHFDGIIAPDFSTYLDFPKPLKLYNLYRMNAFGYWYGQICKRKVIVNARWDFSDSFDSCFDGIREGDIISIGILAGGLKNKIYHHIFERGLKYLVMSKSIRKIILYGSGNYRFMDKFFDNPNIEIREYECKTHRAFRRKRNESMQ